MAINDYTIKFSSNDDQQNTNLFSKPPFVVGEKTTNTTHTSLTLYGKYSIEFGEGLQTNLVRMLENFSRDTPPQHATTGQLWFDTTTKTLMVFTPAPTGSFWKPVGGSEFDVPLATADIAGRVSVAQPLMVDANGTLSLPNVTYAAINTGPTPVSEYTFASNVNFTGGVYSADEKNFINPTVSKPASSFNNYFVTKKYADSRYAILGTAAGGTLLPATSDDLGGIIIGAPFTYDPTGLLSLNNITYTASTNLYEIAADLKVTQELVSGNSDNFIFSDTNKVSADYDNYFITKHFADTNYGATNILPTASTTVAGVVKLSEMVEFDSNGGLTLTNVTYNKADNEYTIDASTKANDNNNSIGGDPNKNYDKFFVTKKYADEHYAASSTGVIGVPIASSVTLGGILVSDPFNISGTGVLSLNDVVFTAAVAATQTDPATPAEFNFSSAIKSSTWLYSEDENNTIGADPDKNYDKFFITKKYADTQYASSGASGQSYTLQIASASNLGGIKVGAPLAISSLGILSLPEIAYDADKTLYDFTATVKTSDDLYSSTEDNNIYKDNTKPSAYYHSYFVTKRFADTHYVLVEDSYVLPISSSTELGGIKVGTPFVIDELGVMTLDHVTLDEALSEYTVDAFLKTQKDIYSTDPYNYIGVDPEKQTSEYDNYFVTKKYVEDHFSSNAIGANTVATATSLGVIKVGQPLSIDALTGVLSLANVSYDIAQNEYNFAAKIKLSDDTYSADIDNYIFQNTELPESAYDNHFTTKHFTDNNYISAGTAFLTDKTSKSKYFIEYSTGFTQASFTGKDNALVNKKYVDDLPISTSTNTTLTSKSILFANNGKIDESDHLTFDSETGTLSSMNGVFANDPADDKTAIVSLYSPNASSTAGASLGLFASEVPIEYPAGQTPPSVPPAIDAGTVLGNIMFGGWDSEASYRAANISAYCTEMWSNTTHGSTLMFSVTPNGDVDPSVALMINNDKSIQIAQCVIETIATPTGTSITLDPNAGSLHKIATSGDTTIALPSVASMTGKSITLIIKYTGTHNITWAGGLVKWSEDLAPITSSAANLTDIFSFFGDGEKIYGVVSGQAYT